MPITIIPTVRCDTLDDPPTSAVDILHDPFKFGNLAAAIPSSLVTGHAYGRVCQNPGPDPAGVHFTDDDALASASIDVKQTFVIDVYWDLSGTLVSAFGGTWIVTIFFDCASNSALDFQIQSNLIPYGCPDSTCFPPTTTNTRQYHASFLVPANTVTANVPTGTPYELDVSIVLLDTCNSLPTTGIVGFVPLEDILFFSV